MNTVDMNTIILLYNRINMAKTPDEIDKMAAEVAYLCDCGEITDPMATMMIGTAIQSRNALITLNELNINMLRYNNVSTNEEEKVNIEKEKKESLDKVINDDVISISTWKKDKE